MKNSKNFKVGDKVKTLSSGIYGIVTDTNITPNKLIVRVNINGVEKDIPKSNLIWVTDYEWEFIESMENRED